MCRQYTLRLQVPLVSKSEGYVGLAGSAGDVGDDCEIVKERACLRRFAEATLLPKGMHGKRVRKG